MKRTFCLAAVALMAVSRPAWAQQDEIARLRAELVNQQAVIAQLLQRVDDLEKKQSAAVTKDDLEQEAKTEQDSMNSVRETLLGKVNVNGYYNFRYFNDGSETHNAFQQDHLGLLLGKQLGRFSFFAELELQNAPHHPQAATDTHTDATASTATADISGEGQVAVENGWMEYNQNRYLSVRVGKQLSPQYWWQNHYPNLTYSTDLPIYLRELFPPELVGVTVQGGAAKPVGASEFGVGYKFYVANNDFEGNSLTDLRDGKAWGGRLQVRFPTSGALKRFDVAGDVPRSRGPGRRGTGRRQGGRLRRADRGQSLPAQQRVRTRPIRGVDPVRLLRAAGRAPAGQLADVLPRRGAREPASAACGEAPSGRCQLSAVLAGCAKTGVLPIGALGPLFHPV